MEEIKVIAFSPIGGGKVMFSVMREQNFEIAHQKAKQLAEEAFPGQSLSWMSFDPETIIDVANAINHLKDNK